MSEPALKRSKRAPPDHSSVLKKKTIRRDRKFVRMNAVELAEATAQYNAEMVIGKFSRPGAEAKARWARARRKPGRPQRGKGAKAISVRANGGQVFIIH